MQIWWTLFLKELGFAQSGEKNYRYPLHKLIWKIYKVLWNSKAIQLAPSTTDYGIYLAITVLYINKYIIVI